MPHLSICELHTVMCVRYVSTYQDVYAALVASYILVVYALHA